MIKYEKCHELDKKIEKIIDKLNLKHIDKKSVKCLRSYGSKAKRTIARCHSLSKPLQRAFDIDAKYAIEVISEKFDKLLPEEKKKVLIHELLHIPKTFGGGFRKHHLVTRKEVEKCYKKLIS